MTGIASYSTTPASNTAINGINIAEGCPPSGINDAIRQLMADVASQGLANFNTQAADTASAATLNLDALTGNYANITGTTTITAITLGQGKEFTTKFAGAVTLTASGSLIPPTGASITTVAGDIIIWRGEASGVVRAINLPASLVITSSGSQTISGAKTFGAGALIAADINGNAVNGFSNGIINGCCRIATRGAKAATNNALVYGGCDRIGVSPASFSSFSGTINQIGGQTWTKTGYAQGLTSFTTTGTGSVSFLSRLESKDTTQYNGKNITVSAWVYQDTGSTLTCTINVNKPTAVDNFAGQSTLGTSGSFNIPTGTPTQVYFTLTLGATDGSNGLQAQVAVNSIGAVTNKNIYFGNFQLEPGSTVTAFNVRPYNIEYAQCQRYCQPVGYAYGNQYATTSSTFYIPLPVEMRAGPTGVNSSYTIASVAIIGSGAASGLASLTAATLTTRFIRANINHNAIGALGNPIEAAAVAGSYIEAEL